MRLISPPSSRFKGAFTLVELLVSMAVLTLLMVLTAQMIGHTLNATTSSNKTMDSTTMARTVLDRLGWDFSSAVLEGDAAVLYYTGSAAATGTIDVVKNSAIGFLCAERARLVYDDKLKQDVRASFVGYKIKTLSFPLTPTKTVANNSMWRGDAAYTYTEKNFGTNKWSPNLYEVMGKDYIPNDLSASSGDEKFLNWGGFADGVVRFHISFVLDDGTIVQIPPSQNLLTPPTPNPTPTFQARGDTGACVPVAFSPSVSSDPNRRYVTSLIVGIVTLDPATLRLAYLNNSAFASIFATQLKRPALVGETPLSTWQENLPKVTFLPVRQNVRFYQRFYPVYR